MTRRMRAESTPTTGDTGAVTDPDSPSSPSAGIRAELVELDAGHMAMISRPAQLAQRLHSIRAT